MAQRFRIREVGRVALGLLLIGAGVLHLTLWRQVFQAQVPPWLPFDKDFVVLASGVVEIILGLAVIVLRGWLRFAIGWVVAAYFVAIFPGNISQLVDSINAVGVEGSVQWIVRLFFQPLLVAWALWSTGAWKAAALWLRTRRATTVSR
ncbi:membrane protein [soil metagenome]